jgi:hypothetical protein
VLGPLGHDKLSPSYMPLVEASFPEKNRLRLQASCMPPAGPRWSPSLCPILCTCSRHPRSGCGGKQVAACISPSFQSPLCPWLRRPSVEKYQLRLQASCRALLTPVFLPQSAHGCGGGSEYTLVVEACCPEKSPLRSPCVLQSSANGYQVSEVASFNLSSKDWRQQVDPLNRN